MIELFYYIQWEAEMATVRQDKENLAYVKYICDLYEYPEGSFEALEKAYNAIIGNTAAEELFFKWISAYESDAIEGDGWHAFLNESAESARLCGESEYTVQLLILILMSPHLRELYRRADIDEAIFYDSLRDLKWKLLECIRMHGIIGNFVADWDILFYQMRIFSLGRLQFEVKKFKREFSVCGVDRHPDTTVLSVHIPSSGRLVREEYLESYARAEKFFSHLFPDGKTVFICASWLLFPEHKVMLPETSGIRIFAEDFSVIEAYYAKPLARPWPLFYEKKNAPADELPTNTSLEKAYAERYKKGLPSGSALGVIIYKDGHILNTEKDKMV
jgi:hypothetical protein